jgi:hypothetical protein
MQINYWVEVTEIGSTMDSRKLKQLISTLNSLDENGWSFSPVEARAKNLELPNGVGTWMTFDQLRKFVSSAIGRFSNGTTKISVKRRVVPNEEIFEVAVEFNPSLQGADEVMGIIEKLNR